VEINRCDRLDTNLGVARRYIFIGARAVNVTSAKVQREHHNTTDALSDLGWVGEVEANEGIGVLYISVNHCKS